MSLTGKLTNEQSDDMTLMVQWFDRVGYSVNLAELHKTFSDVDWQGYAQWAESQDWQFLTGNMVA